MIVFIKIFNQFCGKLCYSLLWHNGSKQQKDSTTPKWKWFLFLSCKECPEQNLSAKELYALLSGHLRGWGRTKGPLSSSIDSFPTPCHFYGLISFLCQLLSSPIQYHLLLLRQYHYNTILRSECYRIKCKIWSTRGQPVSACGFTHPQIFMRHINLLRLRFTFTYFSPQHRLH